MQLGTRWAVGSQPPASVPDDLRPGIADAEAVLGDEGAGLSWTLTWLEGRPVATLPNGAAVTTGRPAPGSFDEDGEPWP